MLQYYYFLLVSEEKYSYFDTINYVSVEIYGKSIYIPNCYKDEYSKEHINF